MDSSSQGQYPLASRSQIARYLPCLKVSAVLRYVRTFSWAPEAWRELRRSIPWLLAEQPGPPRRMVQLPGVYVMERRTFMAFVSGGLLTTTRLAVEAQVVPTVPVGLLTEALLPANRCQSNPPFGGEAIAPRGSTIQGINQGTDGARGSSAPACLEPLSPLEKSLINAAARLHRIIIFKAAAGSSIDALASSLVEQKVAVIIALGTPAALAARRATSTIPIIMVGVSDPVQLGLVPSLARPSGNVTGVSFLAPELVQKSLELLGEISPRPTRIAVVLNPANPGATLVLKTIQPTAQILGMELLPVEAENSAELRFNLDLKLFVGSNKSSRSNKPLYDGLLILADPVFNASRSLIIGFARDHKIPTVFQLRDYVDGGGLISYGPNEEEIYDLSSRYLAKILQGTKPAELPVEQPTKFQLVINLKTAKALGLTIPPSLLARADQVIE